MTLENKKLLDEVGWQILRALQEDARLSFAELGRRVGLSLPAVAERVRRMEEAGIITGYHAQVNLAKVGWPITAFIRMIVPRERYPAFLAAIGAWPEVLEGHHLTGSESFIIKTVVASIADLESFIDRLSEYGQTTTSIVLSSPVTRRIIEPTVEE
ncbi:MAG: Lrp/AsnC family transcriptional regulator [Anaerolineae bacterium]